MSNDSATKFVMIALAAFGLIALLGRVLVSPLHLAPQDASFLETVITGAMLALSGILAKSPRDREPVETRVTNTASDPIPTEAVEEPKKKK